MKWFLAATIFVGCIIIVLLYSNTVLLVYHAPNYSTRPFDALLIHAPMRFFLVLPLSILFALSLLYVIPFAIAPVLYQLTVMVLIMCMYSITLHMNYTPTPTGPPPNYSAWHAGAGAGVVAGANVLALLVVVLRRDLVWCVAAVWINVSLWSSRVQPPAGVNVSYSGYSLQCKLTDPCKIDHRDYVHRRPPSGAHCSVCVSPILQWRPHGQYSPDRCGGGINTKSCQQG
jgi:hypothetical protein